MTPQALSAGCAWLNEAGVRPTRQRVVLAALLVGDGHNRHVTAESLHAAACDAGESISLATVYNTLSTFCDAGLMREITVSGLRNYYDTNTQDHPHFYWEDTRTITDAPLPELEIARLPRHPADTEVVRVDVVIRIRRCSKRNRSDPSAFPQ
ncbi:MAG: transcriptional repressor [Rhodobacteraceae bacterium]|nr:transcriptional repressor [Paracoccaceae bacterium]